MSNQPVQSAAPARGGVQRQLKLPFSKAWEITIKSIKIRLARSLITATGIGLGIAFYSSVRAAGLFHVADTSAEAAAALHRQQWLAIMALLVCFVGIMNSMLMSVTERFKEIGTMKCLGALDSDIVKLFFIEASLMGAAASFAGWLVGWGIIVIVHIFSGGWTSDFAMGSLMQMVVSTAIGMGITLIAGIPPAIHAAQMPSAVALRSSI